MEQLPMEQCQTLHLSDVGLACQATGLVLMDGSFNMQFDACFYKMVLLDTL